MALQSMTRERYGSEYDKHLFEQYKLYVEMADRNSARRGTANSFFLTVNTALITAFTVILKEGSIFSGPIGYAPFAAVLALCYVWWRIIRSYRQLNSGKFKVVHKFEQLLPAQPYADEWIELKEGRDPKVYAPLTHVEDWVPICFGLLYVLLAAGQTLRSI
jgi:hypothetical protein